MDNVYQPPQANLHQNPGTGGPGSFHFGRTFELAVSAYKEQVGFGVGILLLYLLVLVGFVMTCFGIFLAIPHLVAALPVIGYLMIRREATAGSLFIGFKSYGWVLLAFILLALLNYAVSLPFSFPQMTYYYGDFPFDAIGTSDFSSRVAEWSKALSARQAGAFSSGGGLWRVLLSFGSYPVLGYVGARLQLVYPLIILRKMSSIEAIKSSWALTAEHQWMLLLTYVVIAIIAIAGVVLCGFGLLFSLPFGLALQGAVAYQLLGDDRGTTSA